MSVNMAQNMFAPYKGMGQNQLAPCEILAHCRHWAVFLPHVDNAKHGANDLPNIEIMSTISKFGCRLSTWSNCQYSV